MQACILGLRLFFSSFPSSSPRFDFFLDLLSLLNLIASHICYNHSCYLVFFVPLTDIFRLYFQTESLIREVLAESGQKTCSSRQTFRVWRQGWRKMRILFRRQMSCVMKLTIQENKGEIKLWIEIQGLQKKGGLDEKRATGARKEGWNLIPLHSICL